ncbi:MAG: hypothetical protein RI907_1279 [Pseudomonadota bacterium]|jgi:hypothetical protein
MPEQHRRELLARWALAWLAAAMATGNGAAQAQQARPRSAIEMRQLQVHRGDDALHLSYEVQIDLPDDITQALNKGVSVVFVAEAELFRSRWYWMDQPRAKATRRWRLAYQPLTRHWRLSSDGLSQPYNSMKEALDVIRRSSQWRIADPLPANDNQDHYVDFSFKLDTEELPRPLQIGLGGNELGALTQVERRVGVPLPR